MQWTIDNGQWTIDKADILQPVDQLGIVLRLLSVYQYSIDKGIGQNN
ncbi:MAG: hypothetical protein LBB49_00475 [Gracilibacteraceae bacterium]|nr:hypothetical protein [Gracilibacteraceae bacterium]